MESLKNVAKEFKDRVTMAQNEKQVVIQPTSEPCFDFTTDGAYRQKKTVIISPIKVEEYDKNKFKVTYECSRGNYCRDAECKHTIHSRLEREEEPASGVEAFSSHLDR